ncbi:MAG: hypothetical protein K4304_05255 [Propionicimonas sp.]
MFHQPKGPHGTWKTGQRVPETGWWRDQYGDVIQIDRGSTFPPCIDRKGECAYRTMIVAEATA